MSNAVVAFQDRVNAVGELMTPAALTARLSLIQETMSKNMKRGQDYGKIPGTPKPTLFKAGAEKLCSMFQIAPDYETEDLSTNDCVRIRVKCIGKHQGTDVVLGAGIGECSSDEAKYKWRKPVCKEEFEETPEDRRRSKWLPGKGGKAYRQLQVRTEPADLANTVLKMASKRAHVAMTLNVTGATAIFTQDVEDLPEEIRPADEDAPVTEHTERRTPQAKATATQQYATSDQLRVLQAKMKDAGMAEEQLCKRFGLESIKALQFDDLNAALAYVADPQLNEVRQ